MRTYAIRDLDWWGPVEAKPRKPSLWLSWRGLDAPGPAPGPVTVMWVEPWSDGTKYVLRTGRHRGKALGVLSERTLKALVRETPMTAQAARDCQAVRILLATIARSA